MIFKILSIPELSQTKLIRIVGSAFWEGELLLGFNYIIMYCILQISVVPVI